jgi:hypothetical protein
MKDIPNMGSHLILDFHGIKTIDLENTEVNYLSIKLSSLIIYLQK